LAYKVIVDGSMRDKRIAVGIIITNQGKILEQIGKRLGDGTSLQSEFLAIYESLKLMLEFAPNSCVTIVTDCNEVEQVLNGQKEISASSCEDVVRRIRELETKFAKIEYQKGTDQQVRLAHNLAKKALPQKRGYSFRV